jgi:AraC-like DNA-binding protein
VEANALDQLHQLVLRGDTPAISVLNGTARQIHAKFSHLGSNERDQLISGLFGLAARLAPFSATQKQPELESFATICRFIESNLAARDLGPERIARTFGLSRASLYRLFKPVGGVASYVRARRLNRARQELLAAGLDNRRIGPIAYQSGFRSITAFNRAFREIYGETPADARGNRLEGPASSLDTGQCGPLARALLAIAA